MKLILNLEEFMKNKLILLQSLEKLFDKGDSILFRWRADAFWSIEYVSENVLTLLGFSAEEFMSNKIDYISCIDKSIVTRIQSEVTKASQSGVDFFKHEPYKIITKDKKEKWVEDQTVIERDESGNITHFIGLIKDVTKRIELGFQNELLEQRMKLAIESTHDGIWDWDIINDIAYFSKQWKNMLGYEEDDISSTKEVFFELIHPDDREKTQLALQEHFNNKENPYSLEIRFLCKDKTYKWILARGNAIFDAQGKAIRMLGSHIDITEDKKIKEQLQKAQEIARLGIWELNHATQKVTWSDEVFNIFELEKKEFNGSYQSFLHLMHPDDIERVNKAFINSLESQKPYDITHRLLMPDGRIKHILEQSDTDFDEEGNPLLSRGIIQDITELKVLDMKIDSERKRFKTLMYSASDGIFIIDKDLKLIDYSRVAKEMLGYSDAEMHNLRITDWDTQVSEDNLYKLLFNLDEKPVTLETIHKRKNGSIYNASITLVRVEIDGEEYTYASVRDVSELKKLQELALYEKNFIDTIIESSNAVVAVVNNQGVMIKLNSYGQNFTGYTQEEIGQEPFQWKCLIPSIVQDDIKAILEDAKNGKMLKSYQNAWQSKSGELRMFEWSNALVKKEDGSMDYFVAIGLDVTQNEEQKAFLDMLINSQSHMILLADGKELKYVNQVVLDFFNASTLEQMQERFKCICDAFVENELYFHLGKITNNENWIDVIPKLSPEEQVVCLFCEKENKEKIFKINVEQYSNTEAYIVTLIDISDTMKKQLELEYTSYHDSLTKAYNREYFNAKFSSILESHLTNSQLTAIALIDIDNFKQVNDVYGHDVGDEVLKLLVQTIQNNSRKSDTLIRWGGEEFVLILAINSEEFLFKTLNTLRETISKVKMPMGKNITVSIGATMHKNTQTIEKNLKRADGNMYSSKQNGRNRVTIS